MHTPAPSHSHPGATSPSHEKPSSKNKRKPTTANTTLAKEIAFGEIPLFASTSAKLRAHREDRVFNGRRPGTSAAELGVLIRKPFTNPQSPRTAGKFLPFTFFLRFGLNPPKNQGTLRTNVR